MRFKTTLLLVTLCCISYASFGQKLRDKRLGFKYVQLPSQQLPADYMTYSVEVYGNSHRTAGSTASATANSIKMDGYKRLAGGSQNYGHLRLRVNTGYARVGSGEYKTRVSKTKDKDGKETSTTYYFYEFPASAEVNYTIYNPEGDVLDSGSQNLNSTKTSKEYTTSSTLRKNYATIRKGFIKSYASEVTSAAIKYARSGTNKFDFSHQTDFSELFWINKHKDETKFEKYVDEAKEIFKAALPTTPAAELKSKTAEMMAFWQGYADKDPKGDKKLLKIHEATNYNVALMSFFLDDLDKSEQYANKVIAASKKGKHPKSKRLLKKIETTRNLMAANNINTLHYVRDFADAVPPARVAELEAIKEELATANESLGGSATINGEVVNGTFHQEKDAEVMTFGEGGNTKMMIEEGSEMKEVLLTSSDISEFTIGDRVFKKMKFSPCAKGKAVEAMHIMEIVYTSKKINLYQYYPSQGVLSSEKSEFAFMKKDEDVPTSLLDTQFLLWKKGIAKYFQDCSDLNEMCSAGDIKLDKDDLVKAARIYSELCEDMASSK